MLVTAGTKITAAAVFGNMSQLLRKLCHLMNPGLGFMLFGKRSIALRTLRKLVLPDFIDPFGRKQFSEESGMSLLAA